LDVAALTINSTLLLEAVEEHLTALSNGPEGRDVFSSAARLRGVADLCYRRPVKKGGQE
jgi:hypothetical protein